MIWKVLKAHKRSYENPISAKAGDEVHMGQKDNWQGHTWIWCTHQNGLSGWVAESILSVDTIKATLIQDFDALELSVNEGEILKGSKQLGGWVWLSNTQGDSGWVPLKNLEKVTP
jgi:hypothetical protein